jgi:hypothetical protein
LKLNRKNIEMRNTRRAKLSVKCFIPHFSLSLPIVGRLSRSQNSTNIDFIQMFYFYLKWAPCVDNRDFFVLFFELIMVSLSLRAPGSLLLIIYII